MKRILIEITFWTTFLERILQKLISNNFCWTCFNRNTFLNNICGTYFIRSIDLEKRLWNVFQLSLILNIVDRILSEFSLKQNLWNTFSLKSILNNICVERILCLAQESCSSIGLAYGLAQEMVVAGEVRISKQFFTQNVFWTI